MQRAISETDRRREKQVAYNKQHGITPKGIQKAVIEIMEGAINDSSAKILKVAEQTAKYSALSPQQLAKKIKKLEQQMYQHAKNLEFEQAAKLRDELQALEREVLGLSK